VSPGEVVFMKLVNSFIEPTRVSSPFNVIE
jgi:hypothetical protein